MKIVFMGTPDFAVPSLAALVEAGHDIVGVFTQPDKPVGRKQVLTPPAVKVEAQRLGLPIYQPETFKNRACEPLLRSLAPDLIAVVAYGKILPRHVLELPPFGCINLHGSLLPKYRGAAPIQWSVINGEQEAGVTTMYLASGVDTGDMILFASTPIGQYETYGELHDRLAALGAPLLVETVHLIEQGKAPRTPQNNEQATYAPMLDKTISKLDFTRPAAQLSKLICGFETPDSGEIFFDGKDLKDENIRRRARHIGYVMQNPNQMISKTMIFDEVALGLQGSGLTDAEIRTRVEDTLKVCGLYPFRNWPISALSFGQKKRVTIASVLVQDPELIILDEPTAGQDFRHYTDIMEFLRGLNAKGVTVVMITHDMHLMLEYTPRALAFCDGRLIADRSAAAILCDPALIEQAALKETSLYTLANRCGITPAEKFVERFIAADREVRADGC